VNAFVHCLPYLIFLNGSTTLESVYTYINTVEPQFKLKSAVKNSFSIGNLSGFVGDFSKGIASKLSDCPFISEVTPDVIFKASEKVLVEEAPRHLARVSQRKQLRGDYFEYSYDITASGVGVNAYVIDSGVHIEHPQFEGRARHGIDLTTEGLDDYNGHGTHVAGLIGSEKYGVSKNVNIVNVKALDQFGIGSLSSIISAIEFSVKDMTSGNHKGVANLSLGAPKNKALNKVIDAAFDAGLVMVVAAGNENSNACYTSPASATKAITVGSIDDYDDSLTTFTNWGYCVDLFAPGRSIPSVDANSESEPRILSGTSMSSPQVAGVVANLLSRGVTPEKVKQHIIDLSTRNKISRTSLFLKFRTPNRIAYNGVEHDFDAGNQDNQDNEDNEDSNLEVEEHIYPLDTLVL